MEYSQELRSTLTKVEEIVAEHSEALAGGADAAAFRAAVEALRAAMNAVGQTAFVALAEATEVSAQTLERDGTVFRYKQVVPKKWMTLWGKVEVWRRLYQADAGGSSWVPLDAHCGMVDRFLTPELERMVAFLGAHVVPGEVEASLAEVLPEPVSRTAIQHVLTQVGGCAEEHATAVEEAVQQRAPLQTAGDTLVVSWDGVTVPVREAAAKRGRPAERPGVDPTARVPTAWKEAAVGLVACYQSPDDASIATATRVDVRYQARMPEAKMATLMDQLATQTQQALDAGAFAHRVLLADGSREIWRRVEEQSLYADFRCIVDFYHATEHLSKAAEHLFGKEAPQGQAWYSKWRKKLKTEADAVDHLLRSMRYYRHKLPSGSARHTAAGKEMGYFRNHRDKMDYAAYRADGLPIGSGPVEAACKSVVGQRLKRSGMRWSRSGGQHILNLRVQAQSKRWDPFWQWYLQHTGQQATYLNAA